MAALATAAAIQAIAMKKLINYTPSAWARVCLGLLPFAVLLAAYIVASDIRLAQNPSDKLLPSIGSMLAAVDRMALQPSRRSGEYLLWVDTASSLSRLALGVGISAAIALVVGVLNGAVPLLRANLSPLVRAISLVPPMAILPILFIVMGLGEGAKISLIVIGITPFLIRDLQSRTLEIPAEQKIKAQTLGASSWQLIVRILLPQLLPRLIGSVRLSLGSAWLFLIAAEAIASTEGLGYRIFLVRRYLAMDVILPYVLWITWLAFVIDWMLDRCSRRLYPWFYR